VLLIDDQTSGVGAILEQQRLQGILHGTPSGEVVLEKVMSDETVPVGEEVLTSGGDGIFPKGLPVGKVTKVSPGSELFLNIRVWPAVNLSQLEEVLVVTKIDERQAQPEQSGPVRAADILAERLPTVPPKPENAGDAAAKNLVALAGGAANAATTKITSPSTVSPAAQNKLKSPAGPVTADTNPKPPAAAVSGAPKSTSAASVASTATKPKPAIGAATAGTKPAQSAGAEGAETKLQQSTGTSAAGVKPKPATGAASGSTPKAGAPKAANQATGTGAANATAHTVTPATEAKPKPATGVASAGVSNTVKAQTPAAPGSTAPVVKKSVPAGVSAPGTSTGRAPTSAQAERSTASTQTPAATQAAGAAKKPTSPKPVAPPPKPQPAAQSPPQ